MEVALAAQQDRIGLGERDTEGDNDDEGGRRGNRSCRVHEDAQGAMIGVSGTGVEMSNLSDRKQRQQHETQEGDEGNPVLVPAATTREM